MATLGEMLSRAGSLENAERIAKTLSDSDPKFLLDLQLVLSAQGKIDEAWSVSNKALELFPFDARVNFDRGWLTISKGDFLGGLDLLEQGRVAGLWGDPPIDTSKPILNGKDNLSGKSVLLFCEGGLGDQIFSARFATVLSSFFRDTKLIIACHQSLMSLFSRVSGVSAIIDKRVALASYFDYWIPSFSLPKLTNSLPGSLSGSSYLYPKHSLLSSWDQVLDNSKKSKQLKVGIRWAGNPQFEHDQFRSISPELMTSLSDIPGVQLFSFQRDSNLVHLPKNIIDLRPFMKSWEDTAIALSNMDLVISSCTSIAHLAAALGVFTYILVPVMPYYLWAIPGNLSPWYNSVRLVRQKQFASWNSTFAELRSSILEIL